MEEYTISYIGDACVRDVHQIGVNFNGNYYSVIFGRYINGGFCSIPNWAAGCDLAGYDDIYWNAEALSRTLKSKKAAWAIASAIAAYAQGLREKTGRA